MCILADVKLCDIIIIAGEIPYFGTVAYVYLAYVVSVHLKYLHTGMLCHVN